MTTGIWKERTPSIYNMLFERTRRSFKVKTTRQGSFYLKTWLSQAQALMLLHHSSHLFVVCLPPLHCAALLWTRTVQNFKDGLASCMPCYRKLQTFLGEKAFCGISMTAGTSNFIGKSHALRWRCPLSKSFTCSQDGSRKTPKLRTSFVCVQWPVLFIHVGPTSLPHSDLPCFCISYLQGFCPTPKPYDQLVWTFPANWGVRWLVPSQGWVAFPRGALSCGPLPAQLWTARGFGFLGMWLGSGDIVFCWGEGRIFVSGTWGVPSF